MPGTVARVVEIHQPDSVALDGPTGRSTMGLRPASLIRVLPGRADPRSSIRCPRANSERLGSASRRFFEPIQPYRPPLR